MKNFVCSLMIVGGTVGAVATLTFLGCGSPGSVGGGTNGGGGTPGTVTFKLDASPSGSGNGGSGSSTGPAPTSDANCGSVTSNTSHLPADVLLVLDRSGSMDYSIAEDCYCDAALAGRNGTVCADTSNCSTRWPTLTTAVDATLSATSGSINWGLKLFSSTGNGCTVNQGVEVAVSASAVGNIQTQIQNTQPGGNTPTAQAIQAAATYYKGVNDGNNHVILLATDGEPNCATGGSSTPNVQATVDAITAAYKAGYPVYVIGIGPSVGNLNNFAQAGGTNSYYPASSPQALADAFSSISTAVTTCTFSSPSAPPDPNNVAVYLDKNLVTKDPVNGWSFGANNQTIVLNGTTCDQVKSGSATNVEIYFGCGGNPPKIIP